MPEWVAQEIHAAKAQELRTFGREYHDGSAAVVWLANKNQSLRDNVYLLAHRIRRNADPALVAHIIRICEEAGATLSPLRGASLPSPEGKL